MKNLEKWKWQTEKLNTICYHFNESCDRLGAKTAQFFNGSLYSGLESGTLSWAEMKERVESIACGLMDLGVKRKEKIALMSESSPVWTHVDMAISNSGAVSVTIYPTLSVNEMEYIVNDSKCRFLFIQDESLLDKISSGLKKMPSLEKVIVMDGACERKTKKVIGISELMKQGDKFKSSKYNQYDKRWKSVQIDDPYTILYTSGTTGQGKGVILTHRMGAQRLSGGKEFFARYNMTIDENDTGLCFLPLSHIYDRGSMQLLAIMSGASIAYADKPGTLLEDMQKYNPTWINCVPRLYEKIYIQFQQRMEESPVKKKLFNMALRTGYKALEYRRDEKGGYNMAPEFDLMSKLPFFLRIRYKMADKLFAKVRILFGNRFRFSFSASAGIAPDLLKFFYAIGLPVVEGYGSTESFNACILNPLTSCRPGYIGIQGMGSWCRVADDGELEISGAGIFKEYLNKKAETAESFTSDGWFKTGDLVIQDQFGYYKILDRKKAIICTAVGKNIAPAKIENLFSTSSAIDQIFLIGDERNYITALIVPNFNYFKELYDKQGIEYDKDSMLWSKASGVNICVKTGEDFISRDLLIKAVEADVKAANNKLENFEAIKKYTIINERFTEDNGQLTPTQKTKKRVILDAYSDVIESMY